jgi:hypothetical protein
MRAVSAQPSPYHEPQDEHLTLVLAKGPHSLHHFLRHCPRFTTQLGRLPFAVLVVMDQRIVPLKPPTIYVKVMGYPLSKRLTVSRYRLVDESRILRVHDP